MERKATKREFDSFVQDAAETISQIREKISFLEKTSRDRASLEATRAAEKVAREFDDRFNKFAHDLGVALEEDLDGLRKRSDKLFETQAVATADTFSKVDEWCNDVRSAVNSLNERISNLEIKQWVWMDGDVPAADGTLQRALDIEEKEIPKCCCCGNDHQAGIGFPVAGTIIGIMEQLGLQFDVVEDEETGEAKTVVVPVAKSAKVPMKKKAPAKK